MNLFLRAARNFWLSPEERAIRKLIKGLLYTALMAGYTAIGPLLGNHSTNWLSFWDMFKSAAILAFVLSLDKYVTSHFQASVIVKSDSGSMLPIPDPLPASESPPASGSANPTPSATVPLTPESTTTPLPAT